MTTVRDSSGNRDTLATYESHLDAYREKTPSRVEGPLKDWLDRSVAGLAANADILEVGSGLGRDADYLESRGYAVERTDAARSFVDYMVAQGREARLLDVITDGFGENRDLIFADAVFLHLTAPEFKSVLSKAYAALTPGGRLAFTLKEGEGEEWSTEKLDAPRFFLHWNQRDIADLLADAGFGGVHVAVPHVGPQGWLHVVARKIRVKV